MKNNLTKTILAAAAGAATFAGAGVAASANDITVKAGDTLSQIAANNNTTVDDLAAKNNIADVNLIYVGDIIKTDGTATAQPVASTPAATTTTTSSNQAVVSSSTSTQAAATSSANYSSYSAGANGSVQTIINAMNAKRASLGLAPVQYDATLAARAQGRAEESNATGELPTGHMQQIAGPEVVAMGFSASSVVDAWYNETNMIAAPAHRNWLTNASFTKVGFGISGSTIVGIAG